MKFSVIIPTYNRADLLDKCLQSLVEQTYKDFEVLVCDDGSTDHSSQVVASYADRLNVQYLWAENWGGPARPRNCGIAASKGEWICFLDSDDWWAPTKLEACLPYLQNYDMLYHTMQLVSQNDGVLNGCFFRGRIPAKPVFEDMLFNSNCCANSSVVLRKSIVDKVGELSEDKAIIGVEDFDYWLRVSHFTERFFHIDQPLGFYWIGDTSISAYGTQVQRHNALYEKHLAQIKDAALRDQIIARQAYRNARYCTRSGKYEQSLPHYKIAHRINNGSIKMKSYWHYFLNTIKSR